MARNQSFFPSESQTIASHGTPYRLLVRYWVMTDLFNSLADSTRRDIVSLLRNTPDQRGEMSVGELVEALGITQPTVSKHLKVLRDVGIVVVREEGQHRYYRLDEKPLAEAAAWVSGGVAPAVGQAEAFVDLEFLGRATASLINDVFEVVDQTWSKLFR
jgi:DNA-binding transcriptional ArsR family regulator